MIQSSQWNYSHHTCCLGFTIRWHLYSWPRSDNLELRPFTSHFILWMYFEKQVNLIGYDLYLDNLYLLF